MTSEEKRPLVQKVLLAMSGGTDSSVCAMLLLEQGWDVEGVTFRFYEPKGDTQYLSDAIALARSLQIRHHIVDVRERFQNEIVDYFTQEYYNGRTPFPCALCNRTLKFPLLLAKGDEIGADFLATGHYVGKSIENGTHYIRQGVDPDKDQSFFLWGLAPSIVRRLTFPLAGLTKVEVRAYAFSKGFAKVSQKRDSLGICFCREDYRDFIRRERKALPIGEGEFRADNGSFVGWHKGYPFYTVGQRRGLGLTPPYPLYVSKIDPITNRVILSPKETTFASCFEIENGNYYRIEDFTSPVICQIRYRKQQNICRVVWKDHFTADVLLEEPLDAIAPGQTAVFYKDDLVIGGGWIKHNPIG